MSIFRKHYQSYRKHQRINGIMIVRIEIIIVHDFLRLANLRPSLSFEADRLIAFTSCYHIQYVQTDNLIRLFFEADECKSLFQTIPPLFGVFTKRKLVRLLFFSRLKLRTPCGSVVIGTSLRKTDLLAR